MDSHTRQRMRPWLEAKIESGQIKGLEWIKREEKIFKVPWKHGGKHDWNEQDSQIFKEWALHTGRYREGVDSTDWPTWKTRFRCALNKLPDIQEMKNYGKLDGPEPFRAYKLLSKSEISQVRSNSASNSPEMPRSPFPQEPLMYEGETINSMPEKVIKGEITLNDFVIKSANLPSDLRDLNMTPLAENIPTNVDENMDTTQETEVFTRCSSRPPYKHIDHTMTFKLGYRHVDLGSHSVHNAKGCRLYYGPSDLELNAHLQNEVYGPNDVDQVHFPVCYLENKKQEEMTLTLLNHLDRGIVFRVESGQIIATRKCRCSVFVQLQSQSDPVKLIRDEPTIIFDYFNEFEPRLQYYINGRGPLPTSEVLISFGQKWCGGETEFQNNLIWCKVYLDQVERELFKVTSSERISSNLEISRSDNIDQFLRCREETQKQLNMS